MSNIDEYVFCIQVEIGEAKGYYNGAHYIIVTNPYDGNRYKTTEAAEADLLYVKSNFADDIKVSVVDFKTACKEYNQCATSY